MSFPNSNNNSESMYVDAVNGVWPQPPLVAAPQPMMNQEIFNNPPPAVAPIANNGSVLHNNGNVYNNLNRSYNVMGYHPPNHISRLYERSLPNGVGPNLLRVNLPPTPRYVPRLNANNMRRQKRNRTAFTSHQMMELEQEYARTRYLDRTRRIKLAEILHLNERTIKIWFQNRRMKEKKDRVEYVEDSEEVSTTEASSFNFGMPFLTNEYSSATNNTYNGTYGDYSVSTSSSIPMMPQNGSNPMDNTYNVNREHLVPNNPAQNLIPIFYNEEQNGINTESPSNPDNCSTTTNTSNTSNSTEPNLDLSWLHLQDDDFY